MRRRLLALPLLLSLGCGASASPESTAQAFGRALRQGRVGAAYDLLSQDYQRRVPITEFREQVRSQPDEIRRLARLLEESDASGDVAATLTLADGEQVHLILVNGDWRIEGNPANYYDQSTPRRALRSFLRAIEARRYDVVLRFVPSADREGMTETQLRTAWEGEGRESIERLVAVLRENLDQPIEEIGERATMNYASTRVQFVREDGDWKIEDPG